VLWASSFALIACTSKSSSQSQPLTAQQERGRDLFQANCAICHNAYKGEPLQGPPLVAMFRKQALPSGLPATDAHVRDTILTGRRNMPPFNTLLDKQQIDDLLAFLHTL
jgi:mono/diheme cytochrome c family protein